MGMGWASMDMGMDMAWYGLAWHGQQALGSRLWASMGMYLGFHGLGWDGMASMA